jgi:hypothetical protein
MKKVIVRNLYAVGMHHWGGKELSVAAYMLYTYKVKINMYHFTYAKNTMTAV